MADVKDNIDEGLEPPSESDIGILEEEKRILSSAYFVEHQSVQLLPNISGNFPQDRGSSHSNEGSNALSSSWSFSLPANKAPSSLPISSGPGSESGSISGGFHIRLSGTGSLDAGDVATRGDSVEELTNLPPSLDSALRLNIALQRRFRDKIITLERVLKNNGDRQGVLREEIKAANAARELDQRTDGTGKLPLRITHFCVPYFKNRSGMPAPMNDDAKQKVENGYLDLYTTRARTWLTAEKESLNITVREEWKVQSVAEYETQIRDWKRKLRKMEEGSEEDIDKDLVKVIELEIECCHERIASLMSSPLNELIPPLGARLDWDKIAAQAFDGCRTSEEALLMWENLLHPDINTSPWTEDEDIFIQRLISNTRNKVPDWEKIANELQKNRTAFQVMKRYTSFIEPTLNPTKWSKKDDDKLLHTVNMLRVAKHIPWAQVHMHMVGFGRQQIQSRWRLIDPELHKGSFTIEEDCLLIKGLHMFGYDFSIIAHFMHGRNHYQVRDRFRRSFLTSLSSKPWSQEEDAILIEKCKGLGTKKWKGLVTYLPRYDAREIRSRYHTLLVWQSLSSSNMVPPPLFPLTTTLNTEQIHAIREALIVDALNIKQLVDESRKGLSIKNVVKELEDKRLKIKDRVTARNLVKYKKVTEKRGRQRGVAAQRYTPVQVIFMTEYFIPYRRQINYPSLEFNDVKESLIQLCNVFQIKITKHLTESEIQQFSAFGLAYVDSQIIRRITVPHNELPNNGGCSDECNACIPVRSEAIPMLPSCHVTLGAFRSLLFHRPKLKEMASREFFLYKYTISELINLDANFYKGKKPGKKRNPLKFLSSNEPRVLVDHPVSGQGYSSQEESETCDSQASEEEDVPNNGVKSPTKIHITSQDKGNIWKKERLKEKKKTSRIKAYSRNTSKDTTQKQTPNITLENNLGRVNEESTEQRELPQEEKAAKEASDKLLFQRMLALFYWPAVMTMSLPPQELIQRINYKLESTDIDRAPKAQKNTQPKISKDDLTIEEQIKYIEYLAGVDEKAEKIKSEGGLKRKGIKQSPTKKASSPSKKVKIEAGIENDADDEMEEAVEKGYNQPKEVLGKVWHARKTSLKSLRRSLVMKKVWSGRKLGNFPQRTAKRDKRSYKPRGTSTRNCVRTDINVPVGDFLPYADGPTKVQPQLPYMPSEELLCQTLAGSSSQGLLDAGKTTITKGSTAFPPLVELDDNKFTRVVKRRGQVLISHEQKNESDLLENKFKIIMGSSKKKSLSQPKSVDKKHSKMDSSISSTDLSHDLSLPVLDWDENLENNSSESALPVSSELVDESHNKPKKRGPKPAKRRGRPPKVRVMEENSLTQSNILPEAEIAQAVLTNTGESVTKKCKSSPKKEGKGTPNKRGKSKKVIEQNSSYGDDAFELIPAQTVKTKVENLLVEENSQSSSQPQNDELVNSQIEFKKEIMSPKRKSEEIDNDLAPVRKSQRARKSTFKEDFHYIEDTKDNFITDM